ncbi:MAG: NAD-dependent deacylase [Alphaproteobacteria bacterium]|nr:NAD-dependent deacylase [Alphaproteobacteria bacterium]
MTHPRISKIVILTGAGISAESGVATFRDQDGIWAKYDYRDVATPDGFARDPQLVLDFYNMRRRKHGDVQPNAAHLALARLEAEHPANVVIVTQNVDALHEAAGSKALIHMHGEILKRKCGNCGLQEQWSNDITRQSVCPNCKQAGTLRPDVVWFGEMPYHMETIAEHLQSADLFLSIGTSGHVYPAAGFVAEAGLHGAKTVELNLEPSEGTSLFDETIHGYAGEIVPAYVARLLAEASDR